MLKLKTVFWIIGICVLSLVLATYTQPAKAQPAGTINSLGHDKFSSLPLFFPAQVEVREEKTDPAFILEILPLSSLISPNAEDFYITDGFWTVDIEGYGSWIPNIRAGISIPLSGVDIDITGGGGYLWNEAVDAPFYLGDIAARFKIAKNISLGPHIGFVNFDNLDWSERGQVEFSDSTGLMLGIKGTVCINTQNESFIGPDGQTTTPEPEKDSNLFLFFSVDYIEASFDVSTRGGWVANDDEFDLSGVAFNLGLLLRF